MLGWTEVAFLIVGPVATVVLLEGMIRRTTVAVGALLAVTALEAASDSLPFMRLGGTTIGSYDVLGTLFLAAAVARLLRRANLSACHWLFLGFSALALISVVMGAAEFGVNTAINEFRPYFRFLAIALYFSTVTADSRMLDRIGRAWMLLAAFLLGLALLRWAVLPLGLTGGPFGTGTFRVLVSAPTLLLLQAFVIGVLAWSGSYAPRWVQRLTPFLLAAIVLMQHRSVWAALLILMVLMFIRDGRIRRRLVPIVGITALIMVLLSLTVIDSGTSELSEQLADSAAARGTWEWRVEGWQALLEQSGPRNRLEQLIGHPFGGGWDRILNGRVVTVSPHNFYIQTYLRVGLLGVIAIVALYAMLLWRLGSARAEPGLLNREAMFYLLCSQLVFFIPYSIDPAQGLILGLAISAASVAQTARLTVQQH